MIIAGRVTINNYFSFQTQKPIMTIIKKTIVENITIIIGLSLVQRYKKVNM